MKSAVLCKSVIFLFLLLGSFLYSRAQQSPVALLKTVIPPSPNSASLGKYGAWPVSLYTGMPSIEIPIHTVQGRSIQVPVTLSYHASGIKVGEIASWVGLGWALQSGGIITRAVRGLPDDEPTQGYLNMRQRYPNPGDIRFSPNQNVVEEDMEQVSLGARDSEHDAWVFNALGKSYKLVFLGDGSISTIPYSHVKFIPDFLHDLWHVYLEDGTKLVFGGSNNFSERNTASFGEIMGLVSFTSTWHLNTLTTPTGEVIRFSYQLFSTKQEAYFTQSDYIEYPLTIPPGNCIWTEAGTTPNAPPLNVSSKLVATIESDLERVEFIPQTTARADHEGGRALDEIKIFSKTENAYIDSYKFRYSYSEAVEGNEAGVNNYNHYRLKLDSLVRSIPGNGNPQVWSFSYDPKTLPSRMSFAQDHWGYFNGHTENKSLLPKYILPTPPHFELINFLPPAHDFGADREGDKDFITAEMLTRINYPTKGYSNFEYEANLGPLVEDERLVSRTTDRPEVLYTHDMSVNNAPYVANKTITFEVNYVPQILNVSFNSLLAGEFDQVNIQASCVVVDPNNNPVAGSSFNVPLGDTNSDRSAYFKVTIPGTYKFIVGTNAAQNAYQQNAYISVSGFVYYLRSEGMFMRQKLAGGVHVSRITDHGGNGSPDVDRYFTYENPLVIDPVQPDIYINKHSKYGISCQFFRVTRNSASKYSMSLVQGGHVGYRKVTTKYGPNAENGYTMSLFTSVPDVDVDRAQLFPYPPPTAVDWRRGLLEAEVHYKSDGTPVSRLINTYEFEPKGGVVCYKIGFYKTTLPSGGAAPCQQAYQICDLTKVPYDIWTELVKLTSSSQRTFMIRDNHLDSLVANTNYFYDTPSSTAATRTQITNSRNEVIKTVKKTPFQKNDLTGLSADASLAIDSLLRKNMVSTTLEEQTYKNATLLSRVRTNFKYQGGRVLPDNIFLQNGTGPFEKRVQFTRYDSNGNLLEQSKVNDVNTAYVWGFKGNLLLAEVKNATYQQVIDALGQSTLNTLNSSPGTEAQIRQTIQTLRSAPALQKANVTTYTFRPGVGVSSVTDINGKITYYEYDGFNRLSIIKDFNAHILKTWDYHYKQ